MAKQKKSSAEVKKQVLNILDTYIEGFEKIEKDSDYFEGYRAALKAIKENVEKIEVDGDEPPKESKVTIL